MSTNQEPDPLKTQVYSKIGEKLYLKSEKADVYFMFESNGIRIPAHKLLLSSASDVFEAMLYGSLKEESDIRIVDASVEAFSQFLRFFYANEVELNEENVTEIMYLAKKYDVQECLRVCVNFLTTKLTNDNVISIYGLAIVYDVVQLKEICEAKIRKHSLEIFLSDGFLRCDRHILNQILKIDYLSCSESQVVEACMSWLTAASKQQNLTREIMRTHLGDAFYDICFGSMSLVEFLDLLPEYGHLFSGEEYNEILQMISGRKIEPKIFKRQLIVRNDSKMIAYDRAICYLLNDRYIVHVQETTTFSSNKPLLLNNFNCCPIYNCVDGSRLKCIPITVEITSDVGHVEVDRMVCLLEDGGCRVDLKKPLLIKPGMRYSINISFAADQYYALRELQSCAELESNIIIEFHDAPVQNGKVRGIVYGFEFNLLE